MDVEIIVIIVN